MRKSITPAADQQKQSRIGPKSLVKNCSNACSALGKVFLPGPWRPPIEIIGGRYAGHTLGRASGIPQTVTSLSSPARFVQNYNVYIRTCEHRQRERDEDSEKALLVWHRVAWWCKTELDSCANRGVYRGEHTMPRLVYVIVYYCCDRSGMSACLFMGYHGAKQIGVRRALGARLVDYPSLFLTETDDLRSYRDGSGLALIDRAMRTNELQPCPWYVLIVGSAFSSGVMAFLGPALARGTDAPAIATVG